MSKKREIDREETERRKEEETGWERYVHKKYRVGGTGQISNEQHERL